MYRRFSKFILELNFENIFELIVVDSKNWSLTNLKFLYKSWFCPMKIFHGATSLQKLKFFIAIFHVESAFLNRKSRFQPDKKFYIILNQK